MKQTIFTLLLITSIGLISCRKTQNDPDIKQYDDIQIQNYIKANGLTGMQRDPTNGDTSGIYYQILSQGSTAGVTPMDYPDSLAFVFTLKSFDGKYDNRDSVNANHFNGLLGHISTGGLPKGLQSAIHDLVKYKGTRARLLIPSRLAYGVSGYGSGSSTNVNTRIAGNQCLDYYVNVVSNVDDYDDFVINAYMKKNNLTGFTHVTSGRGKGLYYKITTPGSGTGDAIGVGSSYVVSAYSGKFLNDYVFDPGPVSGSPTSFTNESVVVGFQEATKGQTSGTVMSIFIPSRLGYGKAGYPDPTTGTTTIAANVCLYFTGLTIGTVTNP
ncbi:FKBP-type peptidyl-prolyl cis-trans isomerase [Mucilaginibacter sp. SP1R1]|uniref:FKBP-type peptidyl-prolyl cis-trans isomerase n=1 Tax=Mucilaginibacter sp. SP1R1 TaxID=2723091 RepID=UPI00161539FB|nr:FKBP-type peptidyl-prolyl cis-trans isomerase [Mucilaginibacter sp. SP1R1]MBB6147484.1 FKBP-type peptidyl-prolyl cis-trans isomerase [Mucilaginibacter sp. SP1R1]